MDKYHVKADNYSTKPSNEGSMRRNIQIRPGDIISPKPQGRPVGVPQSAASDKKK